MGIARKVLQRLLYKKLCSKGMHPYMAGDIRGDYLKELLDNPERLSLKQRVWAWKRGFLAQKLNNYKLNESNYRDYLSDYDYYMLYPLNNRFVTWIDDKLTLRYMLDRFSAYLPDYYLEIDRDGRRNRLPDFPQKYPRVDDASLVALITEKGVLAAKQNQGSGGDGFYRLEYRDGSFFANGKSMTEQEFTRFLRSLRGYLITEFIVQCDAYMKACPSAAHTLRVQTARMPDDSLNVLFSFLRWGMDDRDFHVAHSTAGVNAAVDVENGEIHSVYYLDKQNRYHENLTRHPVTDVELTGKVPRWDEIVKTCLQIHGYLSELSYIGFDVVITNDGFKILEINSHSGIRTYQHVYPMLKEKRCKAFFAQKLKEKKEG